jgi:hypothetical protein
MGGRLEEEVEVDPGLAGGGGREAEVFCSLCELGR